MNKISAPSCSSSLNHHSTQTTQRFYTLSLLLLAHPTLLGNAAPAVRRLLDRSIVYHGFLCHLILHAHSKDETNKVLPSILYSSLSGLSAVCNSFGGGRRLYQGAWRRRLVLPGRMLCTWCTDPPSKHELHSSGVRVRNVLSRVSDMLSRSFL
jgi:hypothetical protein